MSERIWTCQMFWRAGYRPRNALGPCGCCDSCHDDQDLGYADMCQGTFKGREYDVCCRMSEGLKVVQAAERKRHLAKYWRCDGNCSTVPIGPHRHYGQNVIIPD